MLTLPKDTARLRWTSHIKNKMVYYHLSGAQILRVFRKPQRREEGIAPGTSAAMISRRSSPPSVIARSTRRGNPVREEEIWIMYKLAKPATLAVNRQLSTVTMISAWRYPGRTKPGSPIPIPQDIREELEQGIS